MALKARNTAHKQQIEAALKDKRVEKIKKHYKILCNKQVVKILNYKLKKNDVVWELEIITKNDSNALYEKNVEFEGVDDYRYIKCNWKSATVTPSVVRHKYDIISMG